MVCATTKGGGGAYLHEDALACRLSDGALYSDCFAGGQSLVNTRVVRSTDVLRGRVKGGGCNQQFD